VRIKQLAGKATTDYILVLPSSPGRFLQLFPAVAGAIFSAQKPPVTSPLNQSAIAFVRSRIRMRGVPAAVPMNIQGPCLHMCVRLARAVATAFNHARMHSLLCSAYYCLALRARSDEEHASNDDDGVQRKSM
jgi:hypothetical protein